MTQQPRIMTATELAGLLHKSRSWFWANRARLEQQGLPKKDKTLGGWDRHAVDSWLDRRSNIVSQSSLEAQALEILHGHYHA